MGHRCDSLNSLNFSTQPEDFSRRLRQFLDFQWPNLLQRKCLCNKGLRLLFGRGLTVR